MPPVSQPSTSPRIRATSTTLDESRPAATPLKAQVPAVWTALERLALTQRAPQIMRRHLVRSIVRITVLMTGDAAALLLLRVVLRGIRDEPWLGAATASG